MTFWGNDIGRLFITNVEPNSQDHDLHFKCNSVKVFGCSRVVPITVIKPEDEIWPINFEAVLIKSMLRPRLRYARDISDAGDTLLIEFLSFFPAIPIVGCGHIWIHNWQLFSRLLIWSDHLFFMSYVCVFLLDLSTNKTWFNSGLKREKRLASTKPPRNINENVHCARISRFLFIFVSVRKYWSLDM